jgi:hypothetical protein
VQDLRSPATPATLRQAQLLAAPTKDQKGKTLLPKERKRRNLKSNELKKIQRPGKVANCAVEQRVLQAHRAKLQTRKAISRFYPKETENTANPRFFGVFQYFLYQNADGFEAA